MALLLASNNAGKLRELRALLPGVAIPAPADVDLDLDVAETGTTFAANAALKARAFAKASGHIALADDSGLEVDALNGAPGVYSARYGGPGLDDEGRYRRLLDELKPFPQSAQRSARFRCAIFACAPDGRHCLTEGTCEGQIAHEPAGDHGFGYDPVFLVPAHKATMA
ncbi:MAG: RdgB/HAM1 family non-canonical purine NTP pyrophosphatase, partial [Candidatus Latescibacteria bacterium]|nr:RdgB/HAM1 family non-canonical purine NTP pyrophosphatase [Candidatus Latescibacterota bacterium]